MSELSRVFVSYSHEDKKWLDELKVDLAPLIRSERMVFWDDSAIPPGGQWQEQINAQLSSANVAILC